MKSICLISEEFPPDSAYGGIGIYYGALSEELAKRGIRVFVITSNPNQKPSKETHGNITIIRINCDTKKLWNRFLGYRIKVAKTLCMLQSKETLDIIESPEWKAELFIYLIICGRKKNITIRLHGGRAIIRKNDDVSANLGDRIIMVMERNVLQKCGHISAISGSVLNETEQLTGLNLKKKAIIIPNFIQSVGCFLNHERKKQVLFVGRLDTLKGSYILSKAMDDVLNKYNDYMWIIAGRDFFDDDRKMMASDVIKSNIDCQNHNRVRFLGQIDKNKLYELYCESYITVLPSRYESFGLCCVESMMNRCPVIGSKNGGMSEIIDDKVNGFLIDPNNMNHIRETIEYAIENPMVIDKMRVKARKKVEEKYTSEVVIPNMISYYERIRENKED